MKKVDIGVAIGLLVVSILVYWQANTYREHTIKEETLSLYGPNFFPQVLAVALAGCAILLLINALQGKALKMTDRIHAAGFVRVVICIAICIGYLLLMQVLGFAVSTMIFLFILMTFLGQKNLLIRAVSSVGVAMFIWAIFRFVLIIPTPTGMLPFTF